MRRPPGEAGGAHLTRMKSQGVFSSSTRRERLDETMPESQDKCGWKWNEGDEIAE
jgi:hypothetical protein